MISKTDERLIWPTSGVDNHYQQAALHDSTCFNGHDKKADASDCIICRHVFKGDADHRDNAGGAPLASTRSQRSVWNTPRSRFFITSSQEKS